ncbi:MAG: GIY-YIG nuclease family protein [Planctomycetaceae bacterium]
MGIFEPIFWIVLGAASTLGLLLAFQSQLIWNALANIKNYLGPQRLQRHLADLSQISQQISDVQEKIGEERKKFVYELDKLKQEKEVHRQRIDAEIAHYNRDLDQFRIALKQKLQQHARFQTNRERIQVKLVSSKYVDVSQANVIGGGAEWIYAYTFPHYEQLAAARNEAYYPIKVGMSTQDNVVDRINQQISSSSTAIAERAILRLVFRINDSRDFERYLHQKLTSLGRHKKDALGKEWFNTNQQELERLFADFLLAVT